MQSTPSSQHPALDPTTHPLVRGIARYAAIPHASGKPLRPSTANECKRAAGLAWNETNESSGSRVLRAKAPPHHARPVQPHSLPPSAHATAQTRLAPRLPPSPSASSSARRPFCSCLNRESTTNLPGVLIPCPWVGATSRTPHRHPLTGPTASVSFDTSTAL